MLYMTENIKYAWHWKSKNKKRRLSFEVFLLLFAIYLEDEQRERYSTSVIKREQKNGEKNIYE